MKRRLILLAVVVALLAGFGALLHSPPSLVDAISGATPKAKKAEQASAQLSGEKFLTKAGEYGISARFFKKRHAKLRLDLADRMAQTGLRNAELFRRAGVVANLC